MEKYKESELAAIIEERIVCCNKIDFLELCKLFNIVDKDTTIEDIIWGK